MFKRLLEKERSVSQDLLILTLTLFVAYGSALGADVIGDDLILIRNTRLATWSFQDLAQTFRWDQYVITDGWLPPAFDGFVLQYFRPVVMATIKLDYTLWETWPVGYHLTNIVLYLFIVFIVYFWGADFGLDRPRRLLLGILLILYTLNAMAVIQINGRTETVSAVFILLSIMCLGRFYRDRNPILYATAFAVAVLAFGSKENAVMLPLFHIAAALFLYPPRGADRRSEIRLRVLAILPFFALVPAYFYVRAAAVGGFKMPLGGFYLHQPGDPGFAEFILAKMAHGVIALIYQVPGLIMPMLLEKSWALMLVSVAVAIPTAIAILRWLNPPFRYFLVAWILLSLAPTIPIGLNPIHYFLCSPVIVILYVHLYQSFSTSLVPWKVKTAKVLLSVVVVYGLVISIAWGITVRIGGGPVRNIADSTVQALDQNPAAKEVFFLDVPTVLLYMVPAIRYQSEKYADRAYFILSPGPGVFSSGHSEIVQRDAYTFDLRATQGALLRSGMEEVLLSRRLPPLSPGMVAHHSEYEIEILEVESEPSLEGGWMMRRLRRHFEFPPENQTGILALRFRFQSPLASQDLLFLQIEGYDVSRVEFH